MITQSIVIGARSAYICQLFPAEHHRNLVTTFNMLRFPSCVQHVSLADQKSTKNNIIPRSAE